MAYNNMLEQISTNVQETRDNVHQMVSHMSTNFVGSIPGVEEGIPLKPVRADFMDVGFWKQEAWQEFRNGTRHNATNDAVYSMFMEDQFGDPIPEGERAALREDVHKFWIDLTASGQTPGKYSATGLKISEEFRVTIEGKYPWLRLCEAHWKVKQVWRNCMTAQWNGAKKSKTVANNPDDIKNRVVIEITSSDESSPASKRGRDDDSGAGPSKKHKGKEVAKPNFHPPQPLKKKPTAKVAKASTSLFPLDAPLLRNA